MTTNYFLNCETVSDVKKLYRELAFKYHPDHNREVSDEIFKEINNQYQAILKSLNGQVSVDSSGTYTYRYNQKLETELVNVIDELLKQNFTGIDFYLIGSWIWVSGDTKPYKEDLKKLRFFWHSQRLMWYYRPINQKSYRSNKSLEDIARQYGLEKICTNKSKSLSEK